MSTLAMLLALGSNGSGQLGLGHRDDVSVPSRCILPEEVARVQPLKVATGGNHTLLLLSSGAVYSAGESLDGRNGCSIAGSTGKPALPTPFQLTSIDNGERGSSAVNKTLHKVKLCSATWEASTFVTDADSIYACGTGSRGELGLGEDTRNSENPRFIPDFPPNGTEVIDLAASMSHTVVVLSNGDVWGWGSGRKGQLGQPAVNCWSPRKIEDVPFKAVRAVCGREFTYVVGPPDQGFHTILGSNKWNIISAAPPAVPLWKDIGASWSSVYVLLDSGQLIGWGRNDHGQLPPVGLPKLDQIAVGSEHMLAVSQSGNVLAWGWGEHGNCGTPIDAAGDVQGRWNKMSLDGRVSAIGAGCATSFIYLDND